MNVRDGEPFSWNTGADRDPLVTSLHPGIWTDSTTLGLSGVGRDFFIDDLLTGVLKLTAYMPTTSRPSYEMRRKTSVTSDLTLLPAVRGIWSDVSTMWAAINGLGSVTAALTLGQLTWLLENQDDAKSGDDLDLFGNAMTPRACGPMGQRIWVADWDNAKIYAYNLAELDAGRFK